MTAEFGRVARRQSFTGIALLFCGWFVERGIFAGNEEVQYIPNSATDDAGCKGEEIFVGVAGHRHHVTDNQS